MIRQTRTAISTPLIDIIKTPYFGPQKNHCIRKGSQRSKLSRWRDIMVSFRILPLTSQPISPRLCPFFKSPLVFTQDGTTQWCGESARARERNRKNMSSYRTSCSLKEVFFNGNVSMFKILFKNTREWSRWITNYSSQLVPTNSHILFLVATVSYTRWGYVIHWYTNSVTIIIIDVP